MRMQNAEIEFVTFDVQDVIATSGTLSISGYWDGTQNNLTVNFNDINYTDYDTLKSALNYHNYAEAFSYTSDVPGGSDTFKAAFVDDSQSDTSQGSVYKAGNGDYTYYDQLQKWIRNSPQ